MFGAQNWPNLCPSLVGVLGDMYQTTISLLAFSNNNVFFCDFMSIFFPIFSLCIVMINSTLKGHKKIFLFFFHCCPIMWLLAYMVYLWIKSSADIDATLFQYFSSMAGRPPAGVPLVPGLPRWLALESSLCRTSTRGL